MDKARDSGGRAGDRCSRGAEAPMDVASWRSSSGSLCSFNEPPSELSESPSVKLRFALSDAGGVVADRVSDGHETLNLLVWGSSRTIPVGVIHSLPLELTMGRRTAGSFGVVMTPGETAKRYAF